MSKADDIRMKIADLEDYLFDIQIGQADGDIDTGMVELADLRDELKEGWSNKTLSDQVNRQAKESC